MADHPLRPATDHRLGGPLPHQQANPTRAPPVAINLSRMPLARHPAYAVLAEVSLGYPPQEGRFPRATHPCATPVGAEAPTGVRLACVKHAASVRSEPGSNSHVQSHHNQTPRFALRAQPDVTRAVTTLSLRARSNDPRRRPRIPSLIPTMSINNPQNRPQGLRPEPPSRRGEAAYRPMPSHRQRLFQAPRTGENA